MIQIAYIEAIYRIDEWDYNRLTSRHWRDLIFQTAASESLDYVLQKHPMSAGKSYCRFILFPFTYLCYLFSGWEFHETFGLFRL